MRKSIILQNNNFKTSKNGSLIEADKKFYKNFSFIEKDFKLLGDYNLEFGFDVVLIDDVFEEIVKSKKINNSALVEDIDFLIRSNPLEKWIKFIEEVSEDVNEKLFLINKTPINFFKGLFSKDGICCFFNFLTNILNDKSFDFFYDFVKKNKFLFDDDELKNFMLETELYKNIKNKDKIYELCPSINLNENNLKDLELFIDEDVFCKKLSKQQIKKFFTSIKSFDLDLFFSKFQSFIMSKYKIKVILNTDDDFFEFIVFSNKYKKEDFEFHIKLMLFELEQVKDNKAEIFTSFNKTMDTLINKTTLNDLLKLSSQNKKIKL